MKKYPSGGDHVLRKDATTAASNGDAKTNHSNAVKFDKRRIDIGALALVPL